MYRAVLMLFVDLFLVALATVFAFLLRDNLEIASARFAVLLPYLGLTLLVSAPVLVVLGINRSIWRLSGISDYTQVACAAAVIVVAVVALGFTIDRLHEVARSLPVLQMILMGVLMSGGRAFTRHRQVIRDRRKLASISEVRVADRCETILISGLNKITELYLQSVTEFAADRVKIAGLLGRDARHTGRAVQGHKILGTTEEAFNVLQALEVHGVFVDRVLVTSPFKNLSPRARAILGKIERASNVKVDLFADRVCFDGGGDRSSSFSNRPERDSMEVDCGYLIEAKSAPLGRPIYWRIKRAIDFICAACLIVALLPVQLLVALAVTVDRGPEIIFWQQRPGLGGRPFKLRKFRTMGPPYDCEGVRIAEEKRVSWTGRFLRRSRLDELPQLYNILLGEMSFVGPRPLLPVDQPASYAPRLLVRPGLTGWAQIKGGRQVSATDKATLDIWYVQNASIALDLEILVRTLPVIVFGERVERDAILKAQRELRKSGICAEEPANLLSGFSHSTARQQAKQAA